MNTFTPVYVVTLGEYKEGSSIKGVFDKLSKANELVTHLKATLYGGFSSWPNRPTVHSESEQSWINHNKVDTIRIERWLIQ
jgi:hypothetical protein